MNDIRFLNSHIIDLRKTPWDAEKSNPEKGEYVFTGPKQYYKPLGKEEEYKVGFILRYAPPYREITMSEAMYGITPVRAVDKMYMPEGVRPNAEGYFQVGDVILAKEPKISYLARRKQSVEMSTGGQKAAMDKFKVEAKNEAAKEGATTEVFDL